MSRFPEHSKQCCHRKDLLMLLCHLKMMFTGLDFITALHVMQTRFCDENSVSPSVCLSVRLSHAWIVTKR